MIVDLKRTANIYTGFTIRESVSYLDYGDTKLLQSKDLPNEGHEIVDTSGLSSINWRYDSAPQYLKGGSVVLLARGKPKAYLFNGSVHDRVTVGHIFIVINLISDSVKPQYLAWYINNSSIAKKHFEINSSGSVLNMTSISTVRDLPLVIPTLNEQSDILEQNIRAQQDVNALKRMIELRKEYNQAYNERLITDIHNKQLKIQNKVQL